MMTSTPGTARPCRHRRVPHWRIVPFCAAVLAVGVLHVVPQMPAMAEPRMAPQARPDTQRPPDAPRRIPGEGVQEEPPEAEDDRDERKAAPEPDIGGCPYRGRSLELIV